MWSITLARDWYENPRVLDNHPLSPSKYIILSLISWPSASTITLLIALSISILSNFHSVQPNSPKMTCVSSIHHLVRKTRPDKSCGLLHICSPMLNSTHCVQNPPTSGWASTCCWGAHFTMHPLPSSISANHFGNGSTHSAPLTNLGRTTQRKGILLLAIPQATRRSWKVFVEWTNWENWDGKILLACHTQSNLFKVSIGVPCHYWRGHYLIINSCYQSVNIFLINCFKNLNVFWLSVADTLVTGVSDDWWSGGEKQMKK